MRRMALLPVSSCRMCGWSVGETFDVDALRRDPGAKDGPFGSIHPPGAAADEDVMTGDIRHELAQGLDVAEVRRLFGKPARPPYRPVAGHDEQSCLTAPSQAGQLLDQDAVVFSTCPVDHGDVARS